jgi:mRNA-degrading endonuclease RelE of RelBE toxin-antitoxin system
MSSHSDRNKFYCYIKYKLYRIRVGDYRVIYNIEDDRLIVLVVKIGHRRDVYR